MVARPSIWTQRPKKVSGNTHTNAWGFRRRLRTLYAVCRLLMTMKPAASTDTVTGDIWGAPSARSVARTARWLLATCARAPLRSMPHCAPVAALVWTRHDGETFDRWGGRGRRRCDGELPGPHCCACSSPARRAWAGGWRRYRG